MIWTYRATPLLYEIFKNGVLLRRVLSERGIHNARLAKQFARENELAARRICDRNNLIEMYAANLSDEVA